MDIVLLNCNMDNEINHPMKANIVNMTFICAGLQNGSYENNHPCKIILIRKPKQSNVQ